MLKASKKEDAETKPGAEKKGEGATSKLPLDVPVSKVPESGKSEKGAEGQEAIDKLTRRYHSFAKRMHQTDGDELLEMYLNAFTTSFDPHTDYMSPDTQKNFDIAMSLELEGIGASLQSEDGYTVVKKIIPGGAADKDGRLKAEDKIVGVGQGDEGRNGRRGRHEAQRRGEADPRQAGHRGPPGSDPGRQHRPQSLQDHPREDRAEGQRGEGRGLRRRAGSPTARPTASA